MINVENDWNALTDILSREKKADEIECLYSRLNDEDRMLADILKSIKTAGDDGQAYETKSEVQKDIYRKIFEAGKVEKRPKGLRHLVLRFSAVACLAALVGMPVFFHNRKEARADSQCLTMFSSLNSIAQVVLPDSSIVTLNAGSTLSYPKSYNQKSRQVYLSGEACFDVRPDKEREFIVSSDKVNIRVLGTVFNVCAYPEDAEISTSLISGSVQMRNDENTIICQLAPGQAAIYEKHTAGMTVETFNPESVLGWMSGELTFKKKPFEEVCKILERKFGCTIDIANESIKRNMLTGKFDSDESLSDILGIMQVASPFHYTIKNNCVTIN